MSTYRGRKSHSGAGRRHFPLPAWLWCWQIKDHNLVGVGGCLNLRLLDPGTVKGMTNPHRFAAHLRSQAYHGSKSKIWPTYDRSYVCQHHTNLWVTKMTIPTCWLPKWMNIYVKYMTFVILSSHIADMQWYIWNILFKAACTSNSLNLIFYLNCDK